MKNLRGYFRRFKSILVPLIIIFVLAITAGLLTHYFLLESTTNDSSETATEENQLPTETPIEIGDRESLYGHFHYPEAEPDVMTVISSYGTGEYQRFESLQPEAAKELMKMIYAARQDSIWLVPVSGFRTLKAQKQLFEAQVKRRGSEENAAKVSAPPGYSEHHTGYAIDLTDGNFPNRDITREFENTPAYQWLKMNAQNFGFELSFPQNNSQGISYEPWHWRYIGSPEAQKTFAERIAQ
ncbi:MAG: M15 family metallopeptidase [Oscillatoria sp. PMC 1051.18]|nr:M15 family metallopeptidase [Oscillatoria sp. PMC 1050.18]MEC5032178.1 M15 family metallopeptidase [Oscillatoria sp. PMC 1051.18]